MHNYYLYLVLKQRTFWCIVKQHMKIYVKSEDIDLHTLSVLEQHTCFYSVEFRHKDRCAELGSVRIGLRLFRYC